MISKSNFSTEHIRELQLENHRDPLLLERTVFAFGLLEALVKVGMKFIFKGGTSRIDDPSQFKEEKLSCADFLPLKNLRKADALGYAYLLNLPHLRTKYETGTLVKYRSLTVFRNDLK